MVSKKLLLIIVILIALGINIESRKTTLSVINYRGCFEKLDCKVPLKVGYCNVDYGCISGKCYSTYTKCKIEELCYDKIDNDKDKLIDCKDDDCFKSQYCHCTMAEYRECISQQCYCPRGELASWVKVADIDAWCQCGGV